MVILIFTGDRDAPEIHRVTTYPELEFLEDVVGGWVELIPHFTSIDFEGLQSCTAYRNADRLLPINYTATVAWHHAMQRDGLLGNSVLVGPVVVLAGEL
jgi:hypothetical protein